jgi:plasmid maintenance system antidote protein VapI
MTTSNSVKRHISPTPPGEMLREDFMPDYGLTTASLIGQSLGSLGVTIEK